MFRQIMVCMVLVAFLMPSFCFALPWSMDRPNTKVYVSQHSGDGNKPANTTAKLRFEHTNGVLIKQDTYSDPAEGWMVSLSYSVPNQTVIVAQLIDDATGVVKKQKNVTAGYMED